MASNSLVPQIQFQADDSKDALLAKLRALALTVAQLAQQINQTAASMSTSTGAATTEPFVVTSKSSDLPNSSILNYVSPITLNGATIGINLGAIQLENLGDVAVGVKAAGQLLGWSGTAWTNVNPGSLVFNWSQLVGTPTTLAGYGIASPLPTAQGGTGLSALGSAFTVLAVKSTGSSLEFVPITGTGGVSVTPSDTGIVISAPSIPGPAGPALFILAEDGVDGDQGLPGPVGLTGPPGSGSTGAQGPAGAAIALMAEDGADGDQGLPGPVGQQGPPGSGATGAQGPQGAPVNLTFEDAQGDDGMPIPGPQGLQGATGSQGPVGAAIAMLADDGQDGDDGRPGLNGTNGVTGAQGPAGAAIMMAFENLDGEDGQPIPGPTGAPGNNGATGAQGPAGPAVLLTFENLDGDDGMHIPGNQGIQGATGSQGPLGAAVAMMADDGQDGDDGRPGVNGVNGTNGATGAQGPAGPTALPAFEDAAQDDAVIGQSTPGFVTTTTTPAAGGGGALPATPKGYYTQVINGYPAQIPYY